MPEAHDTSIRLRLMCLSNADILADNTQQAIAASGPAAHIEPRAFAQVWPELMQPGDACDARFLVLDADSLFPQTGEDRGGRFAEQTERLITGLEGLLGVSSRPLIVSTIPAPLAPMAGYIDGWRPGGLRYAIDDANHRLYGLAERHSQLTLVDADIALASIAPVERSDPKLWYFGGLAFSGPASHALALAFAETWHGLCRPRAKVLALDLDNTLWGGILGEDGAAGVACGTAFPGNAYRAFQEECLRLKAQGMLLVILSKNDPAAIETFAARPDMPLTAGDFVAMRINWLPKPDNIRALAAELNLGLDSFLFIDDSAHECEAMRRMCPEVMVPEMPEDAARRPIWLRGLRQTWPAALTREDKQRSAFYAAERQAKALRSSTSNFEEFLAGLEQQVLVAGTDVETVQRVAQMHARTNQFNLTTRRFSEVELRAMIDDPVQYSVLNAQVTDKFGDHGIVAAAVLRFADGTAYVESLLMSCRVIGRRVEQAFIAELAEHAIMHGAVEMQGAYQPTNRNGIVRDFFASAGFQCVEDGEEGSVWQRRLGHKCATDERIPGIPENHQSGQGAYP